MSTTDDTEVWPADESGAAPSTNDRGPSGAVTASAARRERVHPAARPAGAGPRPFLAALLRALSLWPT